MNIAAAFERLALWSARLTGRWQSFAAAVVLVAAWFLAGFHFGFTDQLYQLFINTLTTIITFLMVFLLQHAQNRDTLAIQTKLDELIRATAGARNQMIALEGLSEAQLESLRAAFIALRPVVRC